MTINLEEARAIMEAVFSRGKRTIPGAGVCGDETPDISFEISLLAEESEELSRP